MEEFKELHRQLDAIEAIDINVIKADDSRLFDIIIDSTKIIKLIRLYQATQMDCSRNGKITPEIGAFREKDLIAWLVYNLENVNYDIPNAIEEDVVIENIKISIKHSSNSRAIPNGIKVIWTVDKQSQQTFVENHIFTCDLLLVWIRFNADLQSGELQFIYITCSQLKLHPKPIFKLLGGNNRGIEFDSIFFKNIVANCQFNVLVKFSNIKCTICNPIEKRVQLLKVI